jgi:hypothetical protein
MDAERFLAEIGVHLQRVGWKPCSMFWRKPLRKFASRPEKLKALRKESDRALIDMIRQWQALPPERRTHFLRKRVGHRSTVA